jgi:hypothetical protein
MWVSRAQKVFAGQKWTRGPLAEGWSLRDPRFPKVCFVHPLYSVPALKLPLTRTHHSITRLNIFPPCRCWLLLQDAG